MNAADPRLAELTEALRQRHEQHDLGHRPGAWKEACLACFAYNGLLALLPARTEPKREPGWVNPLSNFGDDENDRMPWQQDEWELPARTATTEAEALAAIRASIVAAERAECDWGDCPDKARLLRRDADKGWLPVCVYHASDADQSETAGTHAGIDADAIADAIAAALAATGGDE